jgi:phosphocarrier protein
VSVSCSANVVITNKLGLHARPAMMFVEAASRFASEIIVSRCDHREPVDGKSIMQMMMLAATQGTELEITARGSDADAAVAALAALIRSRFDEE